MAQQRTTQLLLDRNFGTLFWGKTGSLVATWAFTIITITVAYDVTGSAVWAGFISAAQMAPQLLLALASGRLSDSHGERLPIMVGGFLSGFGALALAGWLLLADADGPGAIPPLIVCALVSGIGLALSAPAMHSMVARIVRPEELSSAVSLNFLPTALARTIGPAGGALLLVSCGTILSMLVVGLVFLLATAAFLRLQSPPPERDDNDDVRIRGAIRYVMRDRIILANLVAVAAIGAGVEPIITLAPAIADLMGNKGLAGWIVAAFGAGGLLGAFVHRAVQDRVSESIEGYAAMTVLAVMIASASWSESLEVLLVVMVVAGCSTVIGLTAFSVAIQKRCAPVMLGRVMAMWVLAFAGVRPLAALAVGFMAHQLSLKTALLGVSGALVLATLALISFVVLVMRHRVSVGRT